MSQLFTLPHQVAINSSGQPYANATATFYRAGTTTPLAVYSTPDLGTAHSNPVVADSAGKFPAIWLDDLSTYQYRVIVRDSGGAVLQDEDLSGSLSNANGNVVMEAPASGRTLTVYQTAGQATDGIQVRSDTGVGNYASLNLLATGVREYRWIAETDSGNLLLRDETALTNRLSITSAGAWTITAASGTVGLTATDGTVSMALGYINSATGLVGTYTNHPIAVMTNNATRITVSAAGAITVADGAGTLYPIGYSDIPRLTSTFVAGKCTALSAGATINTSDMYTGKVFSIYNDSGSGITITQGSGVTLRLAGTASSGNRTLAARGFATFWCNSATEVIGTGAGLS